jgi:hypothetical protein
MAEELLLEREALEAEAAGCEEAIGRMQASRFYASFACWIGKPINVAEYALVGFLQITTLHMTCPNNSRPLAWLQF